MSNGQVKRSRAFSIVGILAEARHLRGGRRGHALRRHQQQVDVLEQRRDTSTESRAAQDDLLIVEAGQALPNSIRPDSAGPYSLLRAG